MKLECKNISFHPRRVSVASLRFGDVIQGPNNNAALLFLSKNGSNITCLNLDTKQEIMIRMSDMVTKKGEISKILISK